jgi:hypothetical protein
MACRPCDRRLSRRRKNAGTSGLSQSAPVSAAAPRPINPETATIVSLLMTTPVPAGGMYNTLGRNTASSLRQRRRHSRVDCGPGIRRFGVGRPFPWRFRAAYPVRQTPRWCARRRAHSSRTCDLRRRAPDAFSAHGRAIILRALGPTIAVADGSAGVRESPHAGGSLFATGYGNKFQMSPR